MQDLEKLAKKEPLIPENEEERLEALTKYLKPNEYPVWKSSYDRLVNLAAWICGVPISYISLIGENTNYQQACYGFQKDSIPRDQSLCQFTIMQDDLLEIQDTHSQEFCRGNPFVEGDFNLRFYAGMPLKSPTGFNVGTLCVVDHKPNSLSDEQRKALKVLADEVVANFELNAARKKLEQVNKEKDELIRIVSHDMRNPLMGIIGFSEYLQTEVADQEHKQILEHIEDAGTSMMGIVNVLLNAEYIQNEAFTLSRKEVDVADLTRDVITLHRPFKLLKHQQLTLNIEEPLKCKIDPEKWKQIIGNLLNNAIKFTPEGGRITLDLKLTGTRKKML